MSVDDAELFEDMALIAKLRLVIHHTFQRVQLAAHHCHALPEIDER